MKYILIIFISYHINGGVGTQEVEFNNLAECITAEKLIIKNFERTIRQAGYRAITSTCLSKSN